MTEKAPHFHLQAPENQDDLLLSFHLGQRIKCAGLQRGHRFTYSQQLELRHVQEAASWGGLHVIPDGPCAMLVVRPTPKLPVGSWAVNLNHIGGAWPTMGQIVAQTGANWVKLRPYTIQGEPLNVVEPLDANWLARICKPVFPLDNLIVSRSGHYRRIGDLGFMIWNKTEELRLQAIGYNGMDAKLVDEEKTISFWMAKDPLLCRAFNRTPEELLSDIGLMSRNEAATSDGLDIGRKY